MHALVVVSGLPGVGKSSLAQALAADVRCCLLEIDRIEAPLLRQAIDGDALGWATYEAMTGLAEQQLGNGLDVILDSVAWANRIRAAWAVLAERTGAAYRPIEVVCSDPIVYRRRIEQRAASEPANPSWDQVQRSRELYWEEWSGDRLIVDSVAPLAAVIGDVVSYINDEMCGIGKPSTMQPPWAT